MHCRYLKSIIPDKYQNKDLCFREFFKWHDYIEPLPTQKVNLFEHFLLFAFGGEVNLTDSETRPYLYQLISLCGFPPGFKIIYGRSFMNESLIKSTINQLIELIKNVGLSKGMSFNFERNSHMLPFIGTLFDALEKFDLQEDISLDFGNTEFGDTEMEFLVKFLRSRGLKKGLHLCFSECKITDSGIKLFTDVLEEKGLVEGLTLNFSGNPIGEEGMNYFIDAIGRMGLKKDMKLYFVQMDGPVSPKSDSENLDSVTNRGTRLINMIERVGLQEGFHLNITHNFFENTDRVFLDFIRNNLLKPGVRLEVRVDIYLRRPIIKAVEAQGHLASYVLGYDSYED